MLDVAWAMVVALVLTLVVAGALAVVLLAGILLIGLLGRLRFWLRN